MAGGEEWGPRVVAGQMEVVESPLRLWQVQLLVEEGWGEPEVGAGYPPVGVAG